MGWIILLMILLLQWNARNWLRSQLDFRLAGNVSVRCDREEGVGGGCATFISEDITYKEVRIGTEQEYVTVKIWTGEGEIMIIKYYNPCRKLDMDKLSQIKGVDDNKVVMCGDFNAHGTLWGGKRTDANVEVIEELDGKNMVCPNNGRGRE